MKIGMINNFEKLIDRMNANEIKRSFEKKERNVTSGLLEIWLKNAELEYSYSCIHGVLVGLNAACFITNEEYYILENELKYYKGKKII